MSLRNMQLERGIVPEYPLALGTGQILRSDMDPWVIGHFVTSTDWGLRVAHWHSARVNLGGREILVL